MKAAIQRKEEQLHLPIIPIALKKTPQNQPVMTNKRWAPVKRMPDIYNGSVKESTIRWLIFNEHQNGFHQCVRRIGGKVLIDLDAFEAWVDSGKTTCKPVAA